MIRLRVHAGPHARSSCPVSLPLALDPDQRVTLYQQPGRRPRACQLMPEGTGRPGSRLHWLVTRLEAGRACDYEVVPTPERRRPVPRMVWEAPDNDHLSLQLDGTPFLQWAAPVEGLPGLRAVRGPGEKLAIEALRVAARLQTREHQSTSSKTQPPITGPVFAQLCSLGFWQDATGLPILAEKVTCACHATPAELRLIDVTIQLTASVGPVNFDPQGTGLLQLVLPTGLVTGELRNCQGSYGPDDIQGFASPWIWLASAKVGLAVFDHPVNPGSPCRWQLGDSLSADPFSAIHRFTSLLPDARLVLATGESLRFRYRLCLLRPDARWQTVAGRYQDFVHPPQIELLAESPRHPQPLSPETGERGDSH